MTYRKTWPHGALFFALTVCFMVQLILASDKFDPMLQIASGFPNSVHLKNKGRLLEFCPDNTCHGFSASAGVSVATLKDFAYLYIYFFSDYYALPEWRMSKGAKQTADSVLSKPEYHSCKQVSDNEKARCILLYLSHNSKIKLIFIRYDEGERNIVNESISEQLSGKPATKH